jgi:DNA-binding transcriptional regulator YhcF (GntR family)
MDDYSDEYDFLGKLDPDSTESPSVQIANRIKAAILTNKFAPGQELPSNSKLQKRFTVARDTVKNAFKILTDREQLVVMQQGKLPRVRVKVHKTFQLRPHIESLFAQDRVAIDFAGFSGETLQRVLAEPIDRIKLGELTPKEIKLRIMVSDMRRPMALPTPIDPEEDPTRVTERMAGITDRALDNLTHDMAGLQRVGLIESSSIEIRMHGIPPVHKLFILNETEVFFGFYPIEKNTVTFDNGEQTDIYDPSGTAANLLYFSRTGEESTQGAMVVENLRNWFNSMWDTIATKRAAA